MARDGEYVDGLKHGYWVSYYADGAKMSEGQYDRGKKTGLWVLYYANGNKRSEAYFVNDKYTGPYTSYHENGKRFRQGRYNDYQGNSADGTKEGLWRQYLDDGETVEQQFTYHRGSKVKTDRSSGGSVSKRRRA